MADRKINRRRRVIYLFSTVCMLGVILGGLWVYRAQHIKNRFAAMKLQGLKAAEAGDAAHAVDFLGDYLARYPTDFTALKAYAKTRPLVAMPNDEQEQRTASALRQILRQRPEDIEARVQLMGIFARTNYYAEALDAANIVLKGSAQDISPPDSTGNAPEAAPASVDPLAKTPKDQVIAVLRKNPDALQAIGVRTHSLLRLHDFLEGLDACALWIAAAPDDVEPALVRVQLLQENHRSADEASNLEKNWEDTTHAPATDKDLLHAHTLLAHGRLDDSAPTSREAKASAKPAQPTTGPSLNGRGRLVYRLLEHAATSNPRSKVAVRVLIADLDAVGETELARQVVIRTVGDNPSDKSALYELVGRDWESGNLTDVIALSSTLQASTAPTLILAMRATAMMMTGKRDEMGQSMQLLRERTTDQEASAWAKIIQQGLDGRGDDTQGIVASCRAALDQNPRDYYLRHFMAEADLQLGERDAAIQEWQRVVSEDPNWALPATRLSTMQLEEKHPEQSLQTAKIAFARSADNGSAALVLAEAWTASIQAGHVDVEEVANCLDFLDQLSKKLPREGRPRVLRAIVLAAIEDTKRATEVVRQAVDGSESLSEQCWIQFETLCQTPAIANPGLARECLARSRKDNGLSAPLALAKAISLNNFKDGLASFDADAATAQATKPASRPAPSTSPGDLATPSQSTPFGWEIARATYLEINHDPAASEAWTAMVNAHPQSLRIQQLALSVPSIRSNKDISERCIQNIKNFGGEHGEIYPLARARYLVLFEPFLNTAGQPTSAAAEARGMLDELVTKHPNSVEIRVLSAAGYEKLNKISDAIQQLQAASNVDPSAVGIRLELARLFGKAGQYDAQRDLFDHLSDKELQSFVRTEDRDRAAAMLAQQGKVDSAIKLLDPGDDAGRAAGKASLRLAELYQKQGKQDSAEKVDQILNPLLANHPDAATLAFGATVLASRNQVDAAGRLLDQLDKDSSVQPGFAERLRAGLEFQKPGGADKAIQLLQQATQKAKTDPASWHMLAGIYLLTNKPQLAFDTAKDGLSSNPKDQALLAIVDSQKILSFVASKEELRPFLYAFVSDPSSAFPDGVLKTIYDNADAKAPLSDLADQLRQIANKNVRNIPLQVYLIRLYDRLRRYDEAITLATQALRATRDSSALHQVEIEAYMATDRNWSDVLVSAKEWESNIGTDKSLATMGAAKALVKLQRPAEASAALQPFVDDPKAQPLSSAYEDILRQYLLAKRMAGASPDVATLLKPYLALGSAGRIQWIRIGVIGLKPADAAEAEAWLRQAATNMPPATSREAVFEHLALAETYDALAVPMNQPKFRQTARDIVRQLVQTPKPEPEAILSMGSMLDRDGDWTNAITYYRQVLAIAPSNALALIQNNLAMALARTGNTAEATTLLDAAIKSFPDSPELLDSRAFVLDQAQKYGAAADTMRQAIRFAPSIPRYHLRLIQILVDGKQKSSAVTELKALDALTIERNDLSPAQRQQLDKLHKDLPAGVANTSLN